MKKTLVTIAIAAMAVASTQAQGFVVFSSGTQNMSTNNVTGGNVVTDPVLGAATAGRTVGVGLYYYALFFSAAQTTINGSAAAQQSTGALSLLNGAAGWTFAGDYGSSSATTGRWTPNGPNGDGTSTVTGVAGGASAHFAILGWSANLGTTLAALQASIAANAHGFLGQSIVSGLITAGDGGLTPAGGISSGGAPGIQAFVLGALPVPEPATMALAGLGGLAMLALRRKK